MKTQKFKSPLAWASLIGLLSVTILTAQDGKLTEDDAFFYEEFDEIAGVYDPFESVNRFTFAFNDFVFSNALQPLVDAYTAITPDTVEEGASNFLRRTSCKAASKALGSRLAASRLTALSVLWAF